MNMNVKWLMLEQRLADLFNETQDTVYLDILLEMKKIMESDNNGKTN